MISNVLGQIESNIYENVAELNASTSSSSSSSSSSSTCGDKVDGIMSGSTKDFPVWKKNDVGSESVRSSDGNSCVLLRVKKNLSDAQTKQQPLPQLQQQPSHQQQQQQHLHSPSGYPPRPLRGTTSYSSSTSMSSYSSSSTSWSSRMKMAMNRKLSSTGTEPTLAIDDASDENQKEK